MRMGEPEIDFARMRAERRRRLSDAMAAQGLDGLVLIGPSNQEYAGVRQLCADAMRMHYDPVVVILPAGGALPHVWTPLPEGVPDDVPATHVHPPLALEFEQGVAALARAVREVLPGARRLGVDELTGPMLQALPGLLPGVELANAGLATGPARLCKTADELACLRHAQRINEIAMYDVEAALRPGIRQTELSGLFLRRVFELGAHTSIIDPVWNLTPRSVTAATVTANGDVGFPVSSNDRFLREGDLVLTDAGITWNGYHSDFGKTWLCSVDPRPDPALRACFERWRALMDAVYARLKPGNSAGDLVRAAAAVEKKHALSHFYLGHGIGCDSGEPPFIGSDLGLAFDDTVELLPGMTFVLEPVVWRDGVGGYRSEEIVAITDTGFERLTRYGYAPFE
jgi:Xaa-Pro aminopeptidase